jgi:protoheme IX farnesyltransferase
VLKKYLSLTKPKVTLGVTLTAIVGYALNAENIIFFDFLILSVGIILLSGGAATFNHIVERDTDALMERTQLRPVASGKISVKSAGIFGTLLITLGFFIFILRFNTISALLGIANALWYVFVYTPLKRASILALVVGSVTGVVPYFIGITSANGFFPNPINLFLGIYLAMWQIPHFLLLIYKYGDEYKKAGLASFTSFFSPKKVMQISLLWIVACCLIALLLPLLGFINHPALNWIIIIINLLAIVIVTRQLVFNEVKNAFKIPFITVNLMQITILFVILIDRLIDFI